MRNLSDIGRIFFGIALVGTGLPAIYFNAYPYYLLPPLNFLTPGAAILHYICGILLILVGTCIVFVKKIRPATLLFGGVLLLIFCFLYIPYQFMGNPKHLHLAEWENAEKELSLAGGAFIIAGCYSVKNENLLYRFLGKLIPLGDVFVAIPIISFGILHFQFAKEVSTMVPSWIPNPIFWTYLAGIGLFGSGISIILKIKTRFIAALLGTIIFIWFAILHIPETIASSYADLGGEITSTFLALAYSGMAFVIAGSPHSSLRSE